jgi:hypothetical protein
MSLAQIAFQACSFNHSDISPSLESTTCERSETDYRTRQHDPAVFRHHVSIQQLTSERRHVAARIVSDR